MLLFQNFSATKTCPTNDFFLHLIEVYAFYAYPILHRARNFAPLVFFVINPFLKNIFILK